MVYIVGIVSVAFLAWVIVFRKPPSLPPEHIEHLEPDTAFVVFLEDEMDYRTDFSKVLVRERIARLEDIALQFPDKKFEARRVSDSLKARLARGAVIVKEEE
jgi:hypothetical protein